MNYLSAENIARNVGERYLFQNLTFGILQGEKVALIGSNGSGKTSLLDIVAGKIPPDGGNVSLRKDIRVGYLDQDPDFDKSKTVLETIFASENAITKAIKNYELAISTNDSNLLAEAMEQIDDLNAWDYDVKVKQILGRLGISDFDKTMRTLSGGQQKRVALARVLIDDPDFLILDEPTNHLDLDTIEWLEGYLASANTTLFLVTHDRYFLDTVCNNIMELSNGNIYKYKGNYAYFLEKKAEREVSEAASVEKAKNLLRKELDWMRRQPKARTHKAQYRVDAFYETKEKASQTVVEEKLQLNMQMTRLGSKIIEINHISKNFGEKKIISEFSYTFKKGDRIGIVGKNGLGKTTLLELITQKIKPDMGSIVKGDTIEIGYYSQGGLDFRDDQRVIDVVLEIAEYIQLAKGQKLTASAFLTLFLFPPAVQYNFVSKLSGGEKRRLQLLKVLIKNPNFLILDEPTNDLDIATLNVLEDFLNSYEGCLLIVSHDRYFMDRLVEHIFGFEGEGKIKDFPGNYTDYREWKEESGDSREQLAVGNEQSVVSSSPSKSQESSSQNQVSKRKLSFKEQKEYETLEKEIANLEQRKEEIIQKMNNGGNHSELTAWAREIEDIGKVVDEKSFRWLELAEFI